MRRPVTASRPARRAALAAFSLSLAAGCAGRADVAAHREVGVHAPSHRGAGTSEVAPSRDASTDRDVSASSDDEAWERFQAMARSEPEGLATWLVQTALGRSVARDRAAAALDLRLYQTLYTRDRSDARDALLAALAVVAGEDSPMVTKHRVAAALELRGAAALRELQAWVGDDRERARGVAVEFQTRGAFRAAALTWRHVRVGLEGTEAVDALLRQAEAWSSAGRRDAARQSLEDARDEAGVRAPEMERVLRAARTLEGPAAGATLAASVIERVACGPETAELHVTVAGQWLEARADERNVDGMQEAAERLLMIAEACPEPRLYRLVGVRLAAERHHRELALDALEAWLRVRPDDVTTLHLQVQVADRDGQAGRAAAAARRALDHAAAGGPDADEGALVRVLEALESSRAPELVALRREALQRLAERFPGRDTIAFALAAATHEEGDAQRRDAILDGYVENAPDPFAARYLVARWRVLHAPREPATRRAIDELLAASSDPQAAPPLPWRDATTIEEAVHHLRIDSAVAARDAETVLRESLALARLRGEDRNETWAGLLAQPQIGTALTGTTRRRFLERAVDAGYRPLAVVIELGELRWTDGDRTGALASWRDAVQMSPGALTPILHRLRDGQNERLALALIETHAAAHGSDRRVRRELALALTRGAQSTGDPGVGLRRVRRALATWREMGDDVPADAETLRALASLGGWDVAWKVGQRLLDQGATSPALRASIAEVALAAGEPLDDARAIVAERLALGDPDEIAAWIEAVATWHSIDEASRLWQRYIAPGPRSDVRWVLGVQHAVDHARSWSPHPAAHAILSTLEHTIVSEGVESLIDGSVSATTMAPDEVGAERRRLRARVVQWLASIASARRSDDADAAWRAIDHALHIDAERVPMSLVFELREAQAGALDVAELEALVLRWGDSPDRWQEAAMVLRARRATPLALAAVERALALRTSAFELDAMRAALLLESGRFDAGRAATVALRTRVAERTVEGWTSPATAILLPALAAAGLHDEERAWLDALLAAAPTDALRSRALERHLDAGDVGAARRLLAQWDADPTAHLAILTALLRAGAPGIAVDRLRDRVDRISLGDAWEIATRWGLLLAAETGPEEWSRLVDAMTRHAPGSLASVLQAAAADHGLRARETIARLEQYPDEMPLVRWLAIAVLALESGDEAAAHAAILRLASGQLEGASWGEQLPVEPILEAFVTHAALDPLVERLETLPEPPQALAALRLAQRVTGTVPAHALATDLARLHEPGPDEEALVRLVRMLAATGYRAELEEGLAAGPGGLLFEAAIADGASAWAWDENPGVPRESAAIAEDGATPPAPAESPPRDGAWSRGFARERLAAVQHALLCVPCAPHDEHAWTSWAADALGALEPTEQWVARERLRFAAGLPMGDPALAGLPMPTEVPPSRRRDRDDAFAVRGELRRAAIPWHGWWPSRMGADPSPSPFGAHEAVGNPARLRVRTDVELPTPEALDAWLGWAQPSWGVLLDAARAVHPAADVAAARAWADWLSAHAPPGPRTWSIEIMLRAESGDVDGARAVFVDAVERTEGNARVWAELAEAVVRVLPTETAASLLTEHPPRDESMQTWLARVWLHAPSAPDRALQAVRNAASRSLDADHTTLVGAEILARAGQWEAVAQALASMTGDRMASPRVERLVLQVALAVQPGDETRAQVGAIAARSAVDPALVETLLPRVAALGWRDEAFALADRMAQRVHLLGSGGDRAPTGSLAALRALRAGSPTLAAEWIRTRRPGVEAAPELTPLAADWARVLAENGDVDAARDVYERRLVWAPNDARAANDLAWLLLESGEDLASAERYARWSLLVGRDVDPAALDTLAMVRLARGDTHGAWRWLRQAMRAAGNALDGDQGAALRAALVTHASQIRAALLDEARRDDASR